MPMPEVTCPRCHTRQSIEGSEGYTCTGCGSSWQFVDCDVCGGRFHAGTDATSWTCPNCGTEHSLVPPREPFGGSRWLLPAGVIVVALVVLIVVLASRGSDNPPAGSTTPSALQQLCIDKQDLAVIRTDSLERTAAKLREDADALRAEGQEDVAAKVDKLVAAVDSLQQAVAQGGENVKAQTDAVLKALVALPC